MQLSCYHGCWGCSLTIVDCMKDFFLYQAVVDGKISGIVGWVYFCFIVILTVYHISNVYSASGNHLISGGTLSNKSSFQRALEQYNTILLTIFYASPYFCLAHEIIEWRKIFYLGVPHSPPQLVPYANLSYIAGLAILSNDGHPEVSWTRTNRNLLSSSLWSQPPTSASSPPISTTQISSLFPPHRFSQTTVQEIVLPLLYSIERKLDAEVMINNEGLRVEQNDLKFVLSGDEKHNGQ